MCKSISSCGDVAVHPCTTVNLPIAGDGTEVTEDAYLKNAGLSRHHAHAIRRRMNTLRSTVRSRKKKEEDHESIRTDSPILVGSKVRWNIPSLLHEHTFNPSLCQNYQFNDNIG